MSVLESKLMVKKETVSVKQCEITIQKVLDMICTSMTKCLDNVYLASEEPVLSTDDYNDEVKVTLDRGTNVI